MIPIRLEGFRWFFQRIAPARWENVVGESSHKKKHRTYEERARDQTCAVFLQLGSC